MPVKQQTLITVSIALFVHLNINICLGQETYKYKITPKIPYASPTDENFINGPFADKRGNRYNCSDTRPDKNNAKLNPKFMPVCALLPDHLVKCNPVFICQHDRYLKDIERQRQISKQDVVAGNNGTDSEANGVFDDLNTSYLDLCKARGCISKIDTGPRPYHKVKFVEVQKVFQKIGFFFQHWFC